ncbi:MAG: MATE family efflux transporter [Pseudomonadota bacterium]
MNLDDSLTSYDFYNDDRIPLTNVVKSPSDTKEQSDLTITGETESSHLAVLFKQALSISPNDVFSAICVMIASSFMAHLKGLSSVNSASVGAICGTAYTVARVVGSCHQIAAVFTILGATAEEKPDGVISISIDAPLLKQSLIQLIKIGLIDSTLATAFLLSVPSIYHALGTDTKITKVSQDFVNIVWPSLYAQILNVGLQQTLFKMDKHKQLVQGASVYLSFALGSMLLSQLVWGPLSDIENIGLSFNIATYSTFCSYLLYLKSKNLLPSVQDFISNLPHDPNKVFINLFHNGNPIAIQLMSELLAVIAMLTMATLLIKHRDLTDALSILNYANTINLTAVVPTITLAQAGCNLMDSYVKLYRETKDVKYLKKIRAVANTTLRAGLIYNSFILLILVAAAPLIASFFYNPNDIKITGISKNPYILGAILGVGLLINSRRDLCLFMQRSLGIFGLAATSSIITLWLINIPAAIALCSLPLNLNVSGILLAYYGIAVPIGAVFLRHKLGEALSEKNLPALLDAGHPEHATTTAKINRTLPERILPAWITQHLYKTVPNEPTEDMNPFVNYEA